MVHFPILLAFHDFAESLRMEPIGANHAFDVLSSLHPSHPIPSHTSPYVEENGRGKKKKNCLKVAMMPAWEQGGKTLIPA